MEQRIGRIHRLGQERPVQIYNLISQGTIETRITELIARKQAVFSALFESNSDQIVFDEGSAFLGQVKAIVEEAAGPSASEGESEEDGIELESLHEEQEPALVVEAEPKRQLPERTNKAQQAHGADASGFGAPLAEVIPALRAIKYERTASGSVRIEAEGDAAKVLAETFAAMARMFSAM